MVDRFVTVNDDFEMPGVVQNALDSHTMLLVSRYIAGRGLTGGAFTPTPGHPGFYDYTPPSPVGPFSDAFLDAYSDSHTA